MRRARTLRAPPAFTNPRFRLSTGERFKQQNNINMSEVTSSDATSVAPVETPSAPAAPVPTFGTSRGSGLARGKRPGAAAPATNKEAAPGGYQPTAIQLVNHQREYKNPFAPEPAPTPAAVETVAAKVEQPVANTPAEQPAPATPAPVATATPAPVETNTPAPQATVEAKAELKILPPEEKARPAQSWEIGSSSQPTSTANAAPRREGRPDFRNDRREPRQERDARPENQNREPRGDFRPREPRERREGGERREHSGEPRREQRSTFEPKPTPAQTEAKKSGFLGWLKGLFGGDSTEQTPTGTEPRREQQSGEDRRHEGGGRGGRHHRGGRNRHRGGEGRGENRGPQFGGNAEGQSHSHGGEHGHGERRFDGNRGGGRRHHRGGRGRFRGEGRGGEHRSDGGSGPSSNGPAS